MSTLHYICVVQLPVHAESAADGVIMQCTDTALSSPNKASHTQGSFVTGHTIWYSMPKNTSYNVHYDTESVRN